MDSKHYLKPTPTEHLLNRLLGVVAGLGVGPGYLHLLQVTGRKTGRIHKTPVNLMEVAGVTYLVAPRGDTQWVRNARKGMRHRSSNTFLWRPAARLSRTFP